MAALNVVLHPVFPNHPWVPAQRCASTSPSSSIFPLTATKHRERDGGGGSSLSLLSVSWVRASATGARGVEDEFLQNIAELEPVDNLLANQGGLSPRSPQPPLILPRAAVPLPLPSSSSRPTTSCHLGPWQRPGWGGGKRPWRFRHLWAQQGLMVLAVVRRPSQSDGASPSPMASGADPGRCNLASPSSPPPSCLPTEQGKEMAAAENPINVGMRLGSGEKHDEILNSINETRDSVVQAADNHRRQGTKEVSMVRSTLRQMTYQEKHLLEDLLEGFLYFFPGCSAPRGSSRMMTESFVITG